MLSLLKDDNILTQFSLDIPENSAMSFLVIKFGMTSLSKNSLT